MFDREERRENKKENKLYQMTLAKYSEKLNELFKAENFTSTTQIDAVVKGAESLVSMQENTLFEKLVETVIQNPNSNLLKKLLAGNLGQAVKVCKPCPPGQAFNYWLVLIMFLEQCPEDVPKDVLPVSGPKSCKHS